MPQNSGGKPLEMNINFVANRRFGATEIDLKNSKKGSDFLRESTPQKSTQNCGKAAKKDADFRLKITYF